MKVKSNETSNCTKNIHDFLIANTGLKDDLILRIAKEQLIHANRIAKVKKEPTQEEIDNYIKSQIHSLQNDAEIVLNDMCKQLIPENIFVYLVKQFSILSVFLLLPFGVLIHVAIGVYFNPPIDSLFHSEIVTSIFLILIVLFVSANSVIKK